MVIGTKTWNGASNKILSLLKSCLVKFLYGFGVQAMNVPKMSWNVSR